MTLDLIIVIALLVLGVLFMLIEIFLLPVSASGYCRGHISDRRHRLCLSFLGSTAGNVSLIASGATLGGVLYGCCDRNRYERYHSIPILKAP